MIRRSYEAWRIDALTSHADARDWISADGQPLDWETILAARDTNVLIADDQTQAHALYQYRAPAVWEGHILCPVHVRGKAAISATLALLAWFDQHIGQHLFTKAHASNRRVRFFMPLIGFRYVESIDGQAYFVRSI